MNCTHCGHENPDRAKFCLECGQACVLRCAGCATQLPAGAKFCLECGTPTATPATVEAAATAATSEPQRDRAPSDYTPKHLADKILQSKSALEGECKQVTVLFADVKGSMDLAEQMGAERWHAILNRFFEILSDGVHRFEGTVNQYTGDGIMALFGAPIAHEDHAQRACYAALRLRDELRIFADELRLSEGLDFSVRMGLNSGDVVVGKIGDDLRMDYTAQGHTVGLAARMESMAPAHGVCVSQNTADLASGYVELRDLGESSIKGASEPVRVFELIGMGAIHSRFDMSRARGLTRFVGRGQDIDLLEHAFEQAGAGNGQVVGVVAQAGTGKSRLCFEFVERCRARGISVLQGTGVAHGKNIPFLPILQIFRQYFGITEQDADRVAREKIAGRLLLIDESFREFLPVMFDFMAVPDPDKPAPSMDPDARQRQLFSVMRRVVARGEGATITLIEDLHWVDAGSEAWIEQLVDATSGSDSLLLLNFRPEYHAHWMQKSWYQQLPLLPLGPEAIQELLDDLLGIDPSVHGLAALVHERTAGNPFFAEEVVQTMIESGHLEGSKGSYRLVTPIEGLEIPSSVKAVLAARIDRLPEREKQLLQAASVIGKEFAEPILNAVLNWPPIEQSTALQNLKNGEFLFELSLYPVTEYAFKHPLTQEVALGSQLQERRRNTHAKVARAIEAAQPERLEEHAALLAHHYDEARDFEQAARFHRLAAIWTLKSDASESRAHWERMLELLRRLDATPDRQRVALEGIELLISNGWRFGNVGDREAALAEEGRQLARRLGDRRSESGIESGYAVSLSCDGQMEKGLEPALQGVRIADSLDDSEAMLISRCTVLDVYWHSGLCREAEAVGQEIAARCPVDYSLGVRRHSFSQWNWLDGRMGLLCYLSGDFAAARKAFEKALAFARDRKEEEVASWLLVWFGPWLGELSGENEHSLTRAQQAVELAGRCGSPLSATCSQYGLGWAELLNGSFDDAVATLSRAREQHVVHKQARGWVDITTGLLAEACLATGDVRRAREMAEAVGERPNARVNRLRSMLSQARVFRSLDGAAAEERVSSILDAAERLVDETGAVAYRPMVVEERGRMTEVLGNSELSRRQLEDALHRYRAISANGNAARLSTELKA